VRELVPVLLVGTGKWLTLSKLSVVSFIVYSTKILDKLELLFYQIYPEIDWVSDSQLKE
jgi:hypothetical protein